MNTINERQTTFVEFTESRYSFLFITGITVDCCFNEVLEAGSFLSLCRNVVLTINEGVGAI